MARTSLAERMTWLEQQKARLAADEARIKNRRFFPPSPSRQSSSGPRRSSFRGEPCVRVDRQSCARQITRRITSGTQQEEDGPWRARRLPSA